MVSLTTTLMRWFRSAKRDLPWRQTTDPYQIWVSEVLLQQTRVNQGFSYYQRFINRFPSIRHLAEADPEQVLLAWQGLGYYSRARNLHKTARLIYHSLQGKFPMTARELKKLPGIGDYTAAAIASIAFNQPDPAIDGNVMRVLGRLFCLPHPVNSTAIKEACHKLMLPAMQHGKPGDVNQAFMELGALICKPVNPLCNDCPIAEFCQSRIAGMQHSFPVKATRNKPRDRFFTYLVFDYQTNGTPFLIMHQRNPGDIWAGLFEFPLIETESAPTDEIILKSDLWQILAATGEPSIKTAFYRKHHLTHQTLHCWFVNVATSRPPLPPFQLVETHLLNQFPYPVLIMKYFKAKKLLW